MVLANEKQKVKKRILLPLPDRFQVIDMLRHYWYVKGLISDKLMEECLSILSFDKNPFLNKEILDTINKKSDEMDYYLSSSIFSIKLEGDIQ